MLRESRSDATIVWTIDRPEVKNALDQATMRALIDAVARAASDSSIRAAILTGAGDAFVSGGDLRELREKTSAADAEILSDTGFDLCRAIESLPFPVIAALPGVAIGGGAELAVACDLRIAHPDARISFKQVRLGVTTAWGTVARLVALVGAGAAARLLYSARDIAAEEAKEIGLVESVTIDPLSEALAWAGEIAKGSPSAVRDMKRLVRAASVMDVRALERELFVAGWSGADHAEAVEAFFARRPPRWQPR